MSTRSRRPTTTAAPAASGHGTRTARSEFVDDAAVDDVVRRLAENYCANNLELAFDSLHMCSGHIGTAVAVMRGWDSVARFAARAHEHVQLLSRGAKGTPPVQPAEMPLRCTQTGELVWMAPRLDDLFASTDADVAKDVVHRVVLGGLGLRAPTDSPATTGASAGPFKQCSEVTTLEVVSRLSFLHETAGSNGDE
jgi:hypothetical protein